MARLITLALPSCIVMVVTPSACSELRSVSLFIESPRGWTHQAPRLLHGQAARCASVSVDTTRRVGRRLDVDRLDFLTRAGRCVNLGLGGVGALARSSPAAVAPISRVMATAIALWRRSAPASPASNLS